MTGCKLILRSTLQAVPLKKKTNGCCLTEAIPLYNVLYCIVMYCIVLYTVSTQQYISTVIQYCIQSGHISFKQNGIPLTAHFIVP